MKKLLTSLLMAAALLLPQILRAEATIWVKSATAPRVYAWDNDNNELLGAWPGTELTQQDAGWWLCYIAGDAPANIVINNGNTGVGNQTADITDVSGTHYYDWDGDGDQGTAPEVTGNTAYTFPTAVVFNKENFPDDNFRSYLKSTYSSKGFTTEGVPITTANLNSITSINCYYKSIASLKGIEYFTTLTSLNCSSNQLTELDVTQNTALTSLNCSSNQLTELDVTQNTALTSLTCSSNQLTELDLSQNVALKSLYCGFNLLTELDVSNHTSLQTLSCFHKETLIKVNASGCSSLKEFSISNSNLEWLNFSGCSSLKTVYCYNNKLSYLNVDGCTTLQSLICHGNLLTELDVSEAISLTFLNCQNNSLTNLNVTGAISLTELLCNINQLTELNVTENLDLATLNCSSNDFSSNGLDLSYNLALIDLNCEKCLLSELNVENNTALVHLNCRINPLTELNLDNNMALEDLCCTGTQITTLDVSNKAALKTIWCYENLLTELNVNGCTALNELDCYRNKLSELNVSECAALTELLCHQNQLTELDLSNNSLLTELSCGSNKIRSLDLSHQAQLTKLTCNSQNVSSDAYIFSNTSIGIPIFLDDEVFRVTNASFPVNGGGSSSCEVVASGEAFCPLMCINVIPDYILLNGPLFNDYRDFCYYYDLKCATEKFANGTMFVTVRVLDTYVLCGENNHGEGNFPDANFRALMQTAEYDKDGDGRLSKEELTPIVELNVPNMGITTMQGIEYMKNLQSLDCSGNQLSDITDLPLTYPGSTKTYNIWLVNLNCSSNQLTGIDVAYNTFLQTLDCSNNKIPGTLNLSARGTLIELHCGNNELTGLTLPSTKTKLVKLTCNDNQLSSLSAAGYTAMTLMDCSNNLLKSLTVAGNSKLETFNCANNQLTSLTLPTTKTALLDLNCSNNKLSKIGTSSSTTLHQYTNLVNLNCGNNLLPSLNLSGNTKLETLNCSTNEIVQLTLPNTTTLTDIDCGTNLLTTLDVSNNTGLTALDCSTNHLVELDLSVNTELTTLDYTNQTRDIAAESNLTTVFDDFGGSTLEKFYYFRLDENISGKNGRFDKPIWERMTDGNYNRVASTFDPERVFGWTDGTIVEGRKHAADADDVRPQNVVGTILVLEDVTEVGDNASGSVSYTYNVQNNRIDADGSKGDFTLRWTANANPDVVTEVTDLGTAGREPVSVTYLNVAGMSSDRPWPGVNIVVKHYSDGTVTTSKLLK